MAKFVPVASWEEYLEAVRSGLVCYRMGDALIDISRDCLKEGATIHAGVLVEEAE